MGQSDGTEWWDRAMEQMSSRTAIVVSFLLLLFWWPSKPNKTSECVFETSTRTGRAQATRISIKTFAAGLKDRTSGVDPEPDWGGSRPLDFTLQIQTRKWKYDISRHRISRVKGPLSALVESATNLLCQKQVTYLFKKLMLRYTSS